MPTKAELEATIAEMKEKELLSAKIARRVKSISIEDLDLTCEVKDCEEAATDKLILWDQDVPFCWDHLDQVKCLLRSLGWSE